MLKQTKKSQWKARHQAGKPDEQPSSGTSHDSPSLDAAGAVPLRSGVSGSLDQSSSRDPRQSDNLPFHETEALQPPRKRAKWTPRESSVAIGLQGPCEYVLFYGPTPSQAPVAALSATLKKSGVISPTCDTINDSFPEAAKVLGPHASEPAFLSKAHLVFSAIHAHDACGSDFRCIVFARDSLVAAALCAFLNGSKIGHRAVRAKTLNKVLGYINTKQRESLSEFASGNPNVLIAHESCQDLELPKADLVINFNLCTSHLSRVYALSHTKGQESSLLQFAEAGNDEHRELVVSTTPLSPELKLWANQSLTSRLGVIPPSTFRQDLLAPYDEDRSETAFLEDAVTHARIHPATSVQVIYHILSAAASLEEVGLPIFRVDRQEDRKLGTGYVYSVLLVAAIGGGAVQGTSCDTEAEAKRSACMAACKHLLEQRLLDHRFLPRLGTQPLQVTQLVAEKASINVRSWYLRKEPDFWQACITTAARAEHETDSPVRLYPTIVTVQAPDMHKWTPIAILTRLPLPDLGGINLFLSGIPIYVRTFKGVPFFVSKDLLQSLRRYTVRVCRTLKNRPFICELNRMPYFVAPLSIAWEKVAPALGGLIHTERYIQWDQVHSAAETFAVPLNLGTLDDDMDDAVVQDKILEFTRRYYVLRVRRDLNPLSQPEPGTREGMCATFKEYVEQRSTRAEQVDDLEQPLLEVAVVPASLNHLSPIESPQIESPHIAAKFLIPQLCMKVVLSASALRTFTLLPSIMKKFDDLMLVKELNSRFFGNSINEEQLHAAITPPLVLMEFDYERLEMLGDAYLKYLYSSYLFLTNSTLREGALHAERQKMVSNKTLLEHATRVGLPQFIQGQPFSHKGWKPPFFDVRGEQSKNHSGAAPSEVTSGALTIMAADASDGRNTADARRSEETDQQVPVSGPPDQIGQDPSPENHGSGAANAQSTSEGNPPARKKNRRPHRGGRGKTFDAQEIADKTIADVVEAILGAAYVTGHEPTAIKAAKAMGLSLPEIDLWTELTKTAIASPGRVNLKIRAGTVKAVQQIVDHEFEHPHFLVQALLHGSLPGATMTLYERLEFLGDAVLDFLVIRHLWTRDSKLHPGALTMLKVRAQDARHPDHPHLYFAQKKLTAVVQGAMVSNSALAALCVTCGLYEHLHHDMGSIRDNVNSYVMKLAECRRKEYAEAKSEGRPPGQYWINVNLDVPKVLSDLLEAVVGALYVSCGFKLAGPEAFFKKTILPFFDKHISLQTVAHHPTAILFEMLQKQGCQLFGLTKQVDWDEEGTMACDVVVHDVVLSRGIDTTISKAARLASLQALDALEGDPGFVRRTCDCRIVAQVRKAQRKASKRFENFGEEDEAEQSALTGQPEGQ